MAEEPTPPGNQWHTPVRPQVLAVIIAICIVLFLDGKFTLQGNVVFAAIAALSGIGGYLLGKGDN